MLNEVVSKTWPPRMAAQRHLHSLPVWPPSLIACVAFLHCKVIRADCGHSCRRIMALSCVSHTVWGGSHAHGAPGNVGRAS